MEGDGAWPETPALKRAAPSGRGGSGGGVRALGGATPPTCALCERMGCRCGCPVASADVRQRARATKERSENGELFHFFKKKTDYLRFMFKAATSPARPRLATHTVQQTNNASLCLEPTFVDGLRAPPSESTRCHRGYPLSDRSCPAPGPPCGRGARSHRQHGSGSSGRSTSADALTTQTTFVSACSKFQRGLRTRRLSTSVRTRSRGRQRIEPRAESADATPCGRRARARTSASHAPPRSARLAV